MGKFRYSSDNLITSSTGVSVGLLSVDPDRGLGLLYDGITGNPTVLEGGDQGYIIFDFGAAGIEPDVIAVMGHNISVGGSVTVQGFASDDPGLSFARFSYQDFITDTLDTQFIQSLLPPWSGYTEIRYLKVTIDNSQGDSDTTLIGQVFIGKAIEFSKNFEWDYKRTRKEESIRSKNQHDTIIASKRMPSYIFDLEFNSLYPVQMVFLEEMYESVGVGVESFYAEIQGMWIYGRLENDFTREHPAPIDDFVSKDTDFHVPLFSSASVQVVENRHIYHPAEVILAPRWWRLYAEDSNHDGGLSMVFGYIYLDSGGQGGVRQVVPLNNSDVLSSSEENAVTWPDHFAFLSAIPGEIWKSDLTPTTPQFIGFDLGAKKRARVKYIEITAATGFASKLPRKAAVQYSFDGFRWHTLATLQTNNTEDTQVFKNLGVGYG